MTQTKSTIATARVALVGRPNVGKSTLLNRWAGKEVSIVTPKPNTTVRITEVQLQSEKLHLTIMDTPGLERPGKVSHQLNLDASMPDVDVVCFVTQGTRWLKDDERWAKRLNDFDKPTIWVINAIDRVKKKEALLPFIQDHSEAYAFAAVVPLSALKAQGLDHLEQAIMPFTSLTPHVSLAALPAELERQLTQAGNESERAQEVIDCVREQLLWQLHDEVPYAANVVVESIEQKASSVSVEGRIEVPEKRHRAIVVGKSGEHIKNIGTRARKKLAKRWGQDVMLHLEVVHKSS